VQKLDEIFCRHQLGPFDLWCDLDLGFLFCLDDPKSRISESNYKCMIWFWNPICYCLVRITFLVSYQRIICITHPRIQRFFSYLFF
jgi:hypothetical protein